jgi:H/ACA ribonucleoprotein complex subunit 2
VLAGDISPIDVISHIPVLCEDLDVQYVYVPSKAELGAAAATKRPTSVVLVHTAGKGDKGKPSAAALAAMDMERVQEVLTEVGELSREA